MQHELGKWKYRKARTEQEIQDQSAATATPPTRLVSMVAWQKPGCFFCSTACIGTPVALKAYQWLVFDIQRGKADQISSFSAAYSLLAAWRCIQQYLDKMAHNSTSTCRRGRRQCVARRAVSFLAIHVPQAMSLLIAASRSGDVFHFPPNGPNMAGKGQGDGQKLSQCGAVVW